jgi:hypothetical protein
MATLFALTNGDISTIGSLNSAAATIANPGTVGSVLSANKPIVFTSSTYTLNANTVGIAICLSSVGNISPSDTIQFNTSLFNRTYPVSALTTGNYTNSYVTTQPGALVGWVVLSWGAGVFGASWSVTPSLSIYGPSYVRLMGSGAAAPASMMIYGSYNTRPQPADILYISKVLNPDLNYGQTIIVNGTVSASNVYICDGGVSDNVFNISNAATNNIYIGRGGIFTGSAVVTGTAGNANQYINVLDGGTLSANYATPTITGRIRAVSGAVVDITNASGFNMRTPGVYSNTTNPNNGFDYLHDITTGYAKFNNVSFWAGISANNKTTSSQNLSVINSTFNAKYVYATTTSAFNDNLISIEAGGTLDNVLLDNISATESVQLIGSFSNLNLKNSVFDKEFDILSSNFTNATLSDLRLSPNSSVDGLTLSANTSLPTFSNIIINGRKNGLMKYDSCNLSIDGLSCLSSYYYSISAADLTGELSNILIKDSTYGVADISFKNTSDTLTVNGLTATRFSNDKILSNSSNGTAIVTAYSPFTDGSSLLLSSISARVTAPIQKLLTYNDDLTIEAWYSPISSILGANQSLITIWDPLSTTSSTLGCVLGLYLNTAGQVVLQKGLSSNGTPSTIATVGTTYALANRRWYHIALTKASNTYTIYFDGHFVLSANATGANELEFFQPRNTGTYNVYIGARPFTRTTFGESLCGYVCGAKIAYGVKYREEFNPSLTPFATDAGTLFNLNSQLAGEYSVMPNSFIELKNAESRYPLTLNGMKFASNNTLSSSLIDLSNSTFEKLEINDSDLSTLGNPLVLGNDVDFVEGSYVFSKCNFLNEVVDATTVEGYQPYNYKESGFAVQYANNNANEHYRWTRGGKVSLDASATYMGTPTEKLESISSEYPVKSTLKMIPVSPSSNIRGISLTYKTPQSYNGSACLKVDKNSLLGINEEAVIGQLPSTNGSWSTVTLSLSNQNTSTWNQKAYLETFVEMTEAGNQLHIAKWQTTTF